MNPVRFGIVGTGNIAHRFANAIKNVPGARLVAVASRNQATADKFGDEFNIPIRFGSYEDMAKSNEIDAAYIGVPHSMHKKCACLMMNDLKHVLCEKPLGVNAKEASYMFECSKQNNVLLMEAMWTRLLPSTIKMLEIVKSGAIGEVMGVEAKFCYTMDENDLDHHVFANSNGGGSLLDVGIYGLNFASYFLGDENVQINAQANIVNGVDTHTCILLKYKNGAIADISSALLLQKPYDGAIYGTKGYILVDTFYGAQKFELHIQGEEKRVINAPYIGNGFEEEIIHFCDCVAKGLIQSPVISPSHTMYITRQMDEIRNIINLTYPQDRQ